MSRTVSHYHLEDVLGRGGMGIVYRAVDTRLGRAVAIKMLPAEATTDPERNRRFVQEARAASALNHPHIVTIHDIDEDDGATFIAMELVDGTPLDRVIAAGRLTIAQALDYAVQAASALEAAHASGIIHRDIKPANIMITPGDRVKVLDFGLAKLIDRTPAESTMTALGTRPGVIMGTAAYMSPEQAEGRPVNARSDIFSFGAVLYEMLAGRRPFQGTSDLGVITAILRDQPPPLRNARSEVPADCEAIVDRCLAKDPDARYADAAKLKDDLLAIQARLSRPAEAGWRKPAVIIPVALVLVAGAAFGVWQAVQASRARWIAEEAIPELERLADDEPLAAVRRARDLERYAPAEVERIRQGWLSFSLVTQPEAVQVSVKEYLQLDAEWEPLGQTPLEDLRLPFGYFRMRLEKPEHLPLEVALPSVGRRMFALPRSADAPPGMVPVPGGVFAVGIAGAATLPDFWIDKLEVTNAEFKKFVDAGGYREVKYWKPPFADGTRVIPFEQAMARFRDTTNRPGPASWEFGTYPDGRADFPVGGISWFEANAYAEFAGKSVPTLHQWYRAAPPQELSSDILRLSNFDGNGPLRAGERQGLGPYGTLDMAGNVKEWCINLAQGTTLRYILGGAWDEPSYRYTEDDAKNPWDRRPTYGLRLVKNLGPVGEAAAPIARVYGDPKKEVPVSAELFEGFKRFYTYDRTPLNVELERVDDSSPHWRKETVRYDAPYGNERIRAHVFLPKNASPPYQAIVLFPSGYALITPSSDRLDMSRHDFIIRSGRALIYPVYQGTFERRQPDATGRIARRDMLVQQAIDLFRSVDYLATRADIDMDRLGYYSLSMGAYFGPIPLALEPRIRAAVLVSGGLRFNDPAEVTPTNFAPHVTIPVLLINGRDDFQAPIEVQRRVLALLGTPAEHKRHVALDGGHVPNDTRGVIREVLDWYDKYLGPVR